MTSIDATRAVKALWWLVLLRGVLAVVFGLYALFPPAAVLAWSPVSGKPDVASRVAQGVAHPLDNPLWSALTGPQAHLAVRHGRAARFPADVSPFAAVANDGEDAWTDLATLASDGGTVGVAAAPEDPPPGWELVAAFPGVQMEGAGLDVGADPEAVRLGPADVPEMLDLVARTQPGPFLPRTITLGTYLGIRRGGTLVAMAGERMRPPGWGEISAVCTDPDHRGQGLAGRLVRAVGAVIRERGDVPFLHTTASNAPGIRLYEKLGFALRRELLFAVLGVSVPVAPRAARAATPARQAVR